MSRLFISAVRFFGPNKQLFESHEELSMYVLFNGLRTPLAGKHEDVTFQCIIRCCAIVLGLLWDLKSPKVALSRLKSP